MRYCDETLSGDIHGNIYLPLPFSYEPFDPTEYKFVVKCMMQSKDNAIENAEFEQSSGDIAKKDNDIYL